MADQEVKLRKPGVEKSLRRPFLRLGDRAAYAAWREAKLAAYPTRTQDFVVEVGDLGAPSRPERDAIRRLARRANMAVYVTRSNLADERATRRALIAFGHAFGLAAIEDHRSAEADGIVRIEVVDQGGRLGYIPYTDRPINWHTDGYYNYHGPERAVRAMLLHCVRPAGEGGVNRLIDPEIAYIRLRDDDPRHIEALMHPAAMTIPESVEANGRVRPENVGPVFFVDCRGVLGMRFTARKRNVVWRDDPQTRAAVARLEAVLADDPLILETRMEAGQGVICNNSLHDRTGFSPSQDSGPGRLLFRIRYADRIDAGEPPFQDS
jgi:Taurine catabolism dioxygenase TauD, TfdA family